MWIAYMPKWAKFDNSYLQWIIQHFEQPVLLWFRMNSCHILIIFCTVCMFLSYQLTTLAFTSLRLTFPKFTKIRRYLEYLVAIQHIHLPLFIHSLRINFNLLSTFMQYIIIVFLLYPTQCICFITHSYTAVSFHYIVGIWVMKNHCLLYSFPKVDSQKLHKLPYIILHYL